MVSKYDTCTSVQIQHKLSLAQIQHKLEALQSQEKAST